MAGTLLSPCEGFSSGVGDCHRVNVTENVDYRTVIGVAQSAGAGMLLLAFLHRSDSSHGECRGSPGYDRSRAGAIFRHLGENPGRCGWQRTRNGRCQGGSVSRGLPYTPPDDDSRWGTSTGTADVPYPRTKRRLGVAPSAGLAAVTRLKIRCVTTSLRNAEDSRASGGRVARVVPAGMLAYYEANHGKTPRRP
jgi:hypothetical protein